MLRVVGVVEGDAVVTGVVAAGVVVDGMVVATLVVTVVEPGVVVEAVVDGVVEGPVGYEVGTGGTFVVDVGGVEVDGVAPVGLGHRVVGVFAPCW